MEGGGGAFATICNLFSKVYFVTIYLSLKKGKLHHHSPSPLPAKKGHFPSMWLVWFM